MDFHALQHKLFALDPVDPKEDLARLRGQAQGAAQAPVESSVDYLQESASVPEGSLKMDRNYSVADFAALAGISEGQKTGSAGQAKGKDPMPKTSTPSRTGEQPHPLKDKLVGEASPDEEDKFHTDLDDLVHKTFGHSSDEEKSDKDRIAELEKRVEALEAMLSERELTKGEVKKRDKTASKIMDKPKAKKSIASWAKDKGMDPEGAVYAIATNMAKKKKSTQTASLDTSDIKNRLYDALNKKMGL